MLFPYHVSVHSKWLNCNHVSLLSFSFLISYISSKVKTSLGLSHEFAQHWTSEPTVGGNSKFAFTEEIFLCSFTNNHPDSEPMHPSLDSPSRGIFPSASALSGSYLLFYHVFILFWAQFPPPSQVAVSRPQLSLPHGFVLFLFYFHIWPFC